jgi:Cellulose binding domain/Fibronectin type III domain
MQLPFPARAELRRGRTGRTKPTRRALAKWAAVLLVAAAPVAVGAAPASAAAASVTVNVGSGLGPIPANAIGLNTAVYDGDMNDAAVPGLLSAAGFNALRYPGGSYSDIFNWQTNTATGGYDAPNTSFSNFMATAQAVGAKPVITTNYGTGTPALAAAWVKDADVTNNYGITDWEVGNEVYGNGTYGSNWETDSHCETSSGTPVTIGSEPAQTYGCGPTTYADNVLQYISAMKAVDPNIKVCAVVTTPGFWPDGVTNATTSPQSWNQTVMSILGAQTQCIIVHYYPGGTTAAGMLTDPTDIPGVVSTLRSELTTYAGAAAANAQIIVTETNATIDDDSQPGALFADDMYMSWLENGVSNVDWWNEHNGAGTVTQADGVTDYGDQGILSNASSSDGSTEPAADTPFAPYYGVELLTKLGAAGDQMVGSSTADSLLKVHAVHRAGGNLDVLLENEDPANPVTVSLASPGFTPTSGTATLYTLANNGTAITTSTQSTSSSITIAPYAMTVVQYAGSAGTGSTAPGAPGQPVVSGLASTTASNTSGTGTLTWPASVAGTNPIAHYNVYQQGSGGSSTLAGTVTTTSFSLTGLTIGASYSYDVVAVDTAGNPSLPSPPVTFTVPPPASSSCSVTYTVSGSWPGGYGANVTVADTGATALSSWTLTFTLPPGEAVQSGWDATWAQSGQAVTVTSASWNGALAANGGSTQIGFNGTDSGSAAPPTVFYLNGATCS